MNTALAFDSYEGMLVSFPTTTKDTSASPFKSNGVKKATPADPIRNPDDIHRIQQYFLDRREIRNYALFTLGISFTLRIGDLLRTTFGDLYNDNGTVKKSFALYEDKTGKRNSITINTKCQEILDAYLDWAHFQLGRWPEADEPLFFSQTSIKSGNLKAISIAMVDKVLARVQRDLNLDEHLSSHSMRKTMIYQTIKHSNYDQTTLYLLQRMLNHSDQRITFRYCGIEDEAISQLREDMGAFLL